MDVGVRSVSCGVFDRSDLLGLLELGLFLLSWSGCNFVVSSGPVESPLTELITFGSGGTIVLRRSGCCRSVNGMKLEL